MNGIGLKVAAGLLMAVILPCCAGSNVDGAGNDMDELARVEQAWVLPAWTPHQDATSAWYGDTYPPNQGLQVCRMLTPAGGKHPGKVYGPPGNPYCRIEYGGNNRAIASYTYDLLPWDSTYSWRDVGPSDNPLNWNFVSAGPVSPSDSTKLPVCEALLNYWWNPGKWYAGQCMYEYGDRGAYSNPTTGIVRVLVKN